jgi:hypothetical protein
MKSKLTIVVTIGSFGLISANTLAIEKNEWLAAVTLNGLVQIEARYNRDYDKKDTSDLVVDEVDLGIKAQIDKQIKANIVFVYEEDITPWEVDEAILTWNNLESLLYVAAGQMYVPFGKFESNMISDPLILQLGEIRETAAKIGFEAGNLYGSFYGFNGTTNDDSDDTIDHYGANFGFFQERENINYDLGLSYISDIGDTDGISDALGEEMKDYDSVNGLSAHFILNRSSFGLMGEYITALDQFNADHLAFNGNGAEPKAWNVEAGYTFNLLGKETIFALGYQATEESLALELPKTRITGVISMASYKNTTISLEYASYKDYDQNDGGTGERAESVIFQVAVEF